MRRLDLFGSAVTERFDAARSDFDFLVAFEPLAPSAYADAFLGLRDGLESMLGRNVDLVTEASLANPNFRIPVESERCTIFVAP